MGKKQNKSNDYEALRAKNIADRNAFMKQLFIDGDEDEIKISDMLPVLAPEEPQVQPAKKKAKEELQKAEKPVQKREMVVQEPVVKKYNTREHKKVDYRYEGFDMSVRKHTKRIPKEKKEKKEFVPTKTYSLRARDKLKYTFCDSPDDNTDEENFGDENDEFSPSASDENENSCSPSPTKKRKLLTPSPRRLRDISNYSSPEEAIDENVVSHSCHLCKQTFKDNMIKCKSDNCIGLEVQFCGSCLEIKYGEDIQKVLEDDKWSCPVCQSLCTCNTCQIPKKTAFVPKEESNPEAHVTGEELGEIGMSDNIVPEECDSKVTEVTPKEKVGHPEPSSFIFESLDVPSEIVNNIPEQTDKCDTNSNFSNVTFQEESLNIDTSTQIETTKMDSD